MIDLYTSRRDKFKKCLYWSQEKDDSYISNKELVYKENPTGFFYAKEINPYTINSQIIAEVFMVEETSVVLQTDDNVPTLDRNDKIELDGKKYFVDNIQRVPIKKQRQFLDNKCSNTTYISLRG